MKDKSKKLFSGHKVDIVFDWRNKSNEEKKGAVSIRLYERGGKRKYINTGVSIFPREWNDELKMVYGRSDAPQLNAQIREVQNLCMQKIKEALEIDGQSESALENAVIKIDTGQTSFLDFIRAGIDNARKTGKLAEPTLIKHEGMLRELEAWGEMKKFADVSPVKINEFIDTIRCKTVGKLDENGKVHPVRISEPAVYNYYKNLRKWINEAIGLGKLPANVLYNTRVKHGQDGKRVHLTSEELQTLISAKMPNAHTQRAKDMFLLQCGTGVAYGDLITIDWGQVQEVGGFHCVSGRRIKNGKQYFLVMLNFAWDALQRLGGKIEPIAVQNYNKFIAEVMAIAGISKHITSHCGRHTYACHCLENHVSISAIQRTLGHTNVRTTQIYAKLMDIGVLRDFQDSNLANK